MEMLDDDAIEQLMLDCGSQLRIGTGDSVPPTPRRKPTRGPTTEQQQQQQQPSEPQQQQQQQQQQQRQQEQKQQSWY